VLSQDAIDRLMEVAKTDPVNVDLETETVTIPFQGRFTFRMDLFRRG
jgi:3-isopropylmalate/(R)-2-methylmalate dehydratase small subunit